MTEDDGSPAQHAIVELLHELCATANTGRSLLGASLDGAVVAAREAVRTWSSRVEELAAQSRARDDAMLLERRARDQVCTILDLIMQLATLPDQPTDRGAVAGGQPGSGAPSRAPSRVRTPSNTSAA